MIKIICIGKLKEQYLVDAVSEYCKRLTKYTKITIIQLDSEIVNNISDLYKERDKIQKHIKTNDYVITLEIEGEQFSSEQFAKKIESTLITNSNIVFIIGGTDGLHEDIKRRSNLKLSFSKMTFPHQLFRVLLLEQIYRSFKIMKNETYHK
ncbi:MAG TPA: 23S rRNA (pseudouridine(1915)-N(3))-methyltransferase RlmH [Mollicutes bacterium]|jgi:23S rRNA (pseudouridine1915-N3)-methyltransferase|nr:23S rRNA (pseudouridine(1915)-N(3))-methyltransferase RlmH [Mollicutes bacterium]